MLPRRDARVVDESCGAHLLFRTPFSGKLPCRTPGYDLVATLQDVALSPTKPEERAM